MSLTVAAALASLKKGKYQQIELDADAQTRVLLVGGADIAFIERSMNDQLRALGREANIERSPRVDDASYLIAQTDATFGGCVHGFDGECLEVKIRRAPGTAQDLKCLRDILMALLARGVSIRAVG